MKLKNTDPPNLPKAANRRSREAYECAQQGRHFLRGQVDEPTRELADIIAARRTDGDGRPLRSTDTCNQDLVRALTIHESPSGTVRAKVQAYLLTDLTFEEIAKRVDESASVVEIYGLCFFDVRSDMSDQAKREVVEAFTDISSHRRLQEYTWKVVALTGGAEALDQVLSPPEVRSAQDAVAASATEAKAITQQKIVEAAKAIDIDDPASIRELHRMLDAIDDAESNDACQNLLEHIKAMFATIPLTVGPPDPETTPPEVLEFESSACELNLDERLKVGLGQELKNKQELLDMRFPDGPDDHAALSKPQKPREEPAAKDAGTDRDAVDPIMEQVFGKAPTKTESVRITLAMEQQLKLKHIKGGYGSPVQRLRAKLAAKKEEKTS